jgi:hypothetical protein
MKKELRKSQENSLSLGSVLKPDYSMPTRLSCSLEAALPKSA